MKIGLYVPTWPPGSTASGIVTYASQLVPALRKLGHEVFVLTPNKIGDDGDRHTIDLRNFASHQISWPRLMSKFAPKAAAFNVASSAIASAVRKLVEKHELDAFEIEESFGWSFAVTRLKLLPVVVRLHGPWFLTGRFDNPPEKLGGDPRREIREGRAIRHADLVTAPSANVLNAVKHYYGLDLQSCRVIPNPIGAALEVKTWDVRHCKSDSLLFVGRFDALKGGDLVIRAFAELAASYPNLKLTFVGTDQGLKGDDGSTQSFQQFVQDNVPRECLSRIKFWGQINHSEVMSLRVEHFATVVASQYESSGYSVLEAMALGCPVVATAVGGIPELIKDESNGLLVRAGDIRSLANGCRRLLEDRALAQRLGSQAWRDCCDLYSPEDIAQQTIAAYREAISAFRDRV